MIAHPKHTMTPDNKVLACVDQSPMADDVAACAAWAAARMGAPLELLHVIDRHPEQSVGQDHSGAIGMDAQAQLLEALSDADRARMLSAREQGRLLLARLRKQALAAGAQSVDVRQRYGELGDTLAEQEAGVTLLVLGRRGKSAQATQRALGRNVERVVRTLRKPMLVVTEGFKPPQRVLIAYDGGASTRRGVEMIASSPLLAGLPLVLLMSGPQRKDAHKQLTRAQARLVAAGFEVHTELLPGDPERVIAQAIQSLGIGLLAMGAYSHSPLRSWFLGSKTSDLLRSAKVPTLLFR